VSRYAVYRNQNPRTRRVYPLLVDVQAELFEDLQTCVIVPLTRAATVSEFPLAHLTPVLLFEGETYVLMTPQLAGVARADLGTHAGSVADQERTISNALEFLFRGF
jgi:toxin CcdB